MTPLLALIVALILASAAGALLLRDLVRSALLFVLSWLGIGAFFLWAGAAFLGFAQILVYGGALSMVVLFAVLLTGRRASGGTAVSRGGAAAKAAAAVGCGLGCAGVLAYAVLRAPLPGPASPGAVSVAELGLRLAGPEAPALIAAGVLLTAALIGAVVLAK